MKIVVAGGSYEAEYIVSMLRGKENELIVINPSKEVASGIVKRLKTPVYVGSPWRKYALEEANAYDADAFIALSNNDADNYACCTGYTNWASIPGSPGQSISRYRPTTWDNRLGQSVWGNDIATNPIGSG